MTLEFHAGAVRSLGDINRAGERFAEKPNFHQTISDVQKYRAFRMRCLNTTLGILAGADMPRHAIVSIRLKRLDSIQRKLERPAANFKLGTLDDVVGVRVVCPSYDEVQAMSRSIQELPECSKSPKNYYERNHPSGMEYRAIHHIMKFSQDLSPGETIPVRFEIQVRSHLQHQWAVWIESKGENAKLGCGGLSKKEQGWAADIKRWEERNPSKTQTQKDLPEYHSERFAVVWKQPSDNVAYECYQSDIDDAVRKLNYLEQRFPHQKDSALLLVGMADNDEELFLALAATHPIYAIGRAYSPEHWWVGKYT